VWRLLRYPIPHKKGPKAAGATSKKKKYGIIAAVVVIVAGLVGASIFTTTNDKQISLSYVEWDILLCVSSWQPRTNHGICFTFSYRFPHNCVI
jgi:hypothetical protein